MRVEVHWQVRHRLIDTQLLLRNNTKSIRRAVLDQALDNDGEAGRTAGRSYKITFRDS